MRTSPFPGETYAECSVERPPAGDQPRVDLGAGVDAESGGSAASSGSLALVLDEDPEETYPCGERGYRGRI